MMPCPKKWEGPSWTGLGSAGRLRMVSEGFAWACWAEVARSSRRRLFAGREAVEASAFLAPCVPFSGGGRNFSSSGMTPAFRNSAMSPA